MRRITIALVVALAALVPVASFSQATVENRATNADLQADAPAEYTVVKGDTLWGISGRFLKEPFKWPLLWSMNRDQIKNPHLIYPGDVVRLDRSGAYPELSLVSGGASGLGARSAEGNVVKLAPRVRAEPLSTSIPSIPGATIAAFLTHPLVVEESVLANAPTVVATEEGRVVVGAGNLAYAAPIGPGDPVAWQIYRPGVALRDPDTGELLGFEAKYVADAQVRRHGHPSTLEVTRTRQEVNKGDLLYPARESTFPSYMPRSPGKPLEGRILAVDNGVLELGQYQIIAVNRGSRDGVEVGHVLASYRRGHEISRDGYDENRTLFGRGASAGPLSGDFFGGMKGWLGGATNNAEHVPVASPKVTSTATVTLPDGTVASRPTMDTPMRIPDERNGLVFVFRVFEKLSYAMVIRATRPIYVGDVVKTP